MMMLLFAALMCFGGFLGLNRQVTAVFLSTAENCNNSVHSTTKNGYTRWTVLQDGDYILQGIFTQTKGSYCMTPALEGTINVAVMQLALERIQKTNFLPGYRLGYQFDNGCVDIPKVMERGIEIVSMYRPNSVCRADFIGCSNYNGNGTTVGSRVKQVVSVIGPGYSYLTIPLASLMGLYNIPHISYQATSRLLSKVNLYNSFFRTIPPDTNQVLVMLDMMQKFHWDYLVAIGSDDDYGKLAISALKDSSQSRNICVAHDEYIPNSKSSMLSRVKDVVQNLKDTPKAKLVVLFTYTSMGQMILNEAEKQGLQRIWLTSDAWSSNGANLNVSKKYLSGIITVGSTKTVIPGLKDFLLEKITNKVHCDPWLQLYLKQTFGCSFSKDKRWMECPGQTAEGMASAMLENNSGGYGNLHDAVYVVSHAIKAMLRQKCHYQSADYNQTLCQPFDSKELLQHMYGVNFTGISNRTVSFDKLGDPSHPHYIIENIKEINGKLQFVKIGSWHYHDQRSFLDLDPTKITWPHPHGNNIPPSKCSQDCQPGQYMHARTECCFSCQNCKARHISTTFNASSCTRCANGYHTDVKRTRCIKTPVVHLTIKSPGGAAIISMSVIGLIISLGLLVMFIQIRNSSVVRESQPSIIYISIVLLMFSFGYGIAHVTEPSNSFCSGRSAYFFLLFQVFTSVLLTSTRLIRDGLTSLLNRAVPSITPDAVQLMVIALLLLVQLACVLIWVKLDPVRMELFPSSDGTQIILECKVDLATSRLVLMAVPCLTLVSATLISFWERNDEHPYNEPKFLSFTTMALTIIVVAFIPTFKFVVGTYKAVVMAFTVDVWAFTYIGCMFAPKMYAFVAQRFHNIGDGGAVPVNDTAYSAHELNGSPDGDGSDGSAGSKNGSSASQRPDSVNGKQGKFSSKGPARQEVYLLKRISISSSPMAHRAGDRGTTEEHDFDHPVEPKFDNNSAKNLMCQT